MFQSHREMLTAQEEVDNTQLEDGAVSSALNEGNKSNEGVFGTSEMLREHYLPFEDNFNGDDVDPSIINSNNIGGLSGFVVREPILKEVQAGKATLDKIYE